jgi:hypothetical protein
MELNPVTHRFIVDVNDSRTLFNGKHTDQPTPIANVQVYRSASSGFELKLIVGPNSNASDAAFSGVRRDVEEVR